MEKAGLNHRWPTIRSWLETHEVLTTNAERRWGRNSSAVLYYPDSETKANLQSFENHQHSIETQKKRNMKFVVTINFFKIF